MATIFYPEGEPYRPRHFDDWLYQPAKYGGSYGQYRELYLPSEFIPCWSDLYGNDTELQSRRRPAYSYWFVPDELKFKNFSYQDGDFNRHRLAKYADFVAHKRPSIELNWATHFTDDDGFDGIRDHRFIFANPKSFNEAVTGPGKEGNYSFVWFTASVGTEGADIVRNSIRDRHREIHHFLHYQNDYEYQSDFMFDDNNYATSPPFTFFDHPCGKHGFTVPMQNLLNNYRQIFNMGSSKFRRLGTFIYKSEVMYAIVVHPPICSTNVLNNAEANFLMQFPQLERDGDWNPDTAVYMNSQNRHVYWKPFSTSSSFSGNYKSVYCRWDQVALAFYFPPGYDGFDLAQISGGYNQF